MPSSILPPSARPAYSHGLAAEVDRAKDLRQEALNAEWRIPDGTIGDIIRQLRYRANRASLRATRLLWALGMVVVAGILFYLAAPIWQRWVDGQRSLLEQTIQNAEQDISLLLPRALTLRDDLEGILDEMSFPVWEGFRGQQSAIFNGVVSLEDDFVIFYGSEAAVIAGRLSGIESEFSPSLGESVREKASLTGHVALSNNSILIYGNDGSLLRFSTTSLLEPIRPAILPEPVENLSDISGHFLADDGALFLFGTSNTFLRSIDGGVTFTVVPFMPDLSGDYQLNDILPASQSESGDFRHLILAAAGSSDDGSVNLLQHTKEGVSRLDEELLPEGLGENVYYTGYLGVSEKTLLLFGDEGTMLTFDPTSFNISLPNFPTGFSETVIFQNGFVTETGTVILYGDEQTLLHFDESESRLSRLSGLEEVVIPPNITGHVQLDQNRWLLFGSESGILIYDDVTGRMSNPVLPEGLSSSIIFNAVSQIDDEVWIATGDEGTVLLSQNKVASFERHSVATSAVPYEYFGFDTTTNDGPLLVVPGHGIFLRDDVFAKKLSSIASPPVNSSAEATESFLEELLKFIELELPSEARVLLADFRQELNLVRAEQAFQLSLIQRTQDARINLERFPNSLIQEQERRDFEAFLRVCIAPTIDDNSASTSNADLLVACLSAWDSQLAQVDDAWWDTLASQVPPGVLILFLLSTLGGLYRYNTRMAGFFHGRADTLTLLASGVDSQIIDAIETVSTALASDRVEFSNKSTPSDQAIDLAKTIASRSPT